MRRWFSQRIEHPVNAPMLLMGLALVLVAASSLFAVLDANSSRDDAQARANRADATSNCRSKLATAVTDATTTYQFAVGRTIGAIGEVVTGLAQGGDLTMPLEHIATGTSDVAASAGPLTAAVATRVAFEANPGPVCPHIPKVAPPAPTTTTTTTTVPSTTTTVRRARRAVTTTTTRPAQALPVTTTTTFYSSPTTVPRGRLCDLLPLTIPGVSTCL